MSALADLGAPLRLLVVDDDAVDRMAVRRYLEQAGLRVTIDELSTGAEVFARASASAYDCILLDASLPGADGVEIIVELRGAGVLTPVLIIAGQDAEAGAALVAAGATDYLSKEDLSAARLERRLRYVLRLAAAERGAAEARREVEAHRRLLETVLQHLPIGVVVAEAQGRRISVCNPAAQALFGPGAPELVAAPPGAPSSELVAAARELVARAWREGEVIAADDAVEHDQHRFRLVATPVDGADGEVAVVALTLDDVTPELHAKEAAERVARARQELLAVVSHDLRGPLNSIGVALDGLTDASVGEADRGRYAAAVTRSIHRADRLIGDLLMAARLETGSVQLEPSTFSVRGLFEQAVRDHELVATQAKVSLVIGEVEDVEVQADRERLLQALSNLVENALKHARGTSEVTFSARRVDATVQLRTEDRGPGVPEGARTQLFEPFWQGQGRRHGAGLGLSIVRGIARAHGGDVSAEDVPGGGAAFVISLPS